MTKITKATAKKIRMIHISKKVPKGFVELTGSSHLGNGIWAFQCESIVPDSLSS